MIPPLESLSENSPSEILHSLQKGKLQLELELGNENENENHHSPLERRKNQGFRDSNQVLKQQAASGSSGFGSRLPYERFWEAIPTVLTPEAELLAAKEVVGSNLKFQKKPAEHLELIVISRRL